MRLDGLSTNATLFLTGFVLLLAAVGESASRFRVLFIRDRDVSLLGWDMMDARPDGYGLPWPVHGVIFSFGVPLLDNALLEPLAAACAEERRYEFMLMVLP